MYFDTNLKLLPGKNYSKSKQTKYLGFVKLGVRWAERDNGFDEKFMVIFRMFAVYPPIAASEARFLAANSRGNKKNRVAAETYDCKHCNRSFNKQYNLLIHERSHEKSENQTLFNCNICGKGFRSMNNMKNHRYFFFEFYLKQDWKGLRNHFQNSFRNSF